MLRGHSSCELVGRRRDARQGLGAAQEEGGALMICVGIATCVKNFCLKRQSPLQFMTLFAMMLCNLCLKIWGFHTSKIRCKGPNWQVNINRRIQCQNSQSLRLSQHSSPLAHVQMAQTALTKSSLSWCLSPSQQSRPTQANTSNPNTVVLSARAAFGAPHSCIGIFNRKEVLC